MFKVALVSKVKRCEIFEVNFVMNFVYLETNFVYLETNFVHLEKNFVYLETEIEVSLSENIAFRAFGDVDI